MCTLLAITVTLLISIAGAAKITMNDCYGKQCNAVDEYCSSFGEDCDKCSNVCDKTTHNYNADICSKQCAEYMKYDSLKDEIHAVHTQQNITLILIIILVALMVVRYAYLCVRWLRRKRCITLILKKLHLKRRSDPVTHSGKNIGGTTIQNMMAINDVERAQSQIYSITGAEGSVMTMTTPVSTRYPAEDSTPTTTPTEHSYVNEALAVTPVAEKPHGSF